MMRKSSVVIGAICAVAVLLMTAEVSQGAITDCSVVTKSTAQCMNYLVGKEPAPSQACCTGIRNLHAAATTTADRRKACECMLQAANKMKALRDDNARKLPNSCGVRLAYPISRNVKCST